jgi:hypothetical protein
MHYTTTNPVGQHAERQHYVLIVKPLKHVNQFGSRVAGSNYPLRPAVVFNPHTSASKKSAAATTNPLPMPGTALNAS